MVRAAAESLLFWRVHICGGQGLLLLGVVAAATFVISNLFILRLSYSPENAISVSTKAAEVHQSVNIDNDRLGFLEFEKKEGSRSQLIAHRSRSRVWKD